MNDNYIKSNNLKIDSNRHKIYNNVKSNGSSKQVLTENKTTNSTFYFAKEQEIKKLNLVNSKILHDSNRKNDIIKELTNENFELKNKVLNLSKQINTLNESILKYKSIIQSKLISNNKDSNIKDNNYSLNLLESNNNKTYYKSKKFLPDINTLSNNVNSIKLLNDKGSLIKTINNFNIYKRNSSRVLDEYKVINNNKIKYDSILKLNIKNKRNSFYNNSLYSNNKLKIDLSSNYNNSKKECLNYLNFLDNIEKDFKSNNSNNNINSLKIQYDKNIHNDSAINCNLQTESNINEESIEKISNNDGDIISINTNKKQLNDKKENSNKVDLTDNTITTNNNINKNSKFLSNFINSGDNINKYTENLSLLVRPNNSINRPNRSKLNKTIIEKTTPEKNIVNNLFINNNKEDLSKKTLNIQNNLNQTMSTRLSKFSNGKRLLLDLESNNKLSKISIKPLTTVKNKKIDFINNILLLKDIGNSFYDNFKLNSKVNYEKTNSILEEINGKIPFVKYDKFNISLIETEVKKYISIMSSYNSFIEYIGNSIYNYIKIKQNVIDNKNYTDDITTESNKESVEDFYYFMRCIIKDFICLTKNILNTNNLIYSMKKFNNKYTLDELFRLVYKTVPKILNCKKAILFLYNKKDNIYFSYINQDSTIKNSNVTNEENNGNNLSSNFSNIDYRNKNIITISGNEPLLKDNLTNLNIKPIILDKAYSHFSIDSDLRKLNKELNITSNTLMIVPVYSYGKYEKDTNNVVILDEAKKKAHINARIKFRFNSEDNLNKNFYKKLSGILILINKSNQHDTLGLESKDSSNYINNWNNNNNKYSNSYFKLNSKSSKKNSVLSVAKDSKIEDNKLKIDNNNNNLFDNEKSKILSFNSNDESSALIISQQISNSINMTFTYTAFNNKEYKISKVLELINYCNSNYSKDHIVLNLISTITKIFVSDKVQIVLPIKKDDVDKYASYSAEKYIEYDNLTGLVEYSYTNKQPIFVFDSKDNNIYNPLNDIESCNTLYTTPIFKNKDNYSLPYIVGVLQFEYYMYQVPWENNIRYYGLTSFDNELLESVLLAVSNVL